MARTSPPLVLCLLLGTLAACGLGEFEVELREDAPPVGADASTPDDGELFGKTHDGGTRDGGGSGNHAPVVPAPTASPSPAPEAAPVTMSVMARDPDDDALSFEWAQDPADLQVALQNANGAQANFLSPAVPADTVLHFTVRACDPGGLCTTSPVLALTVRNTNGTPSADLQGPSSVLPGDTVALDGTHSSDPDADPLTFQITQSGGPSVALMSASNGARASFTAPGVSTATTLSFSLTVCDRLSQCASATKTVTVNPSAVYVSASLGSDSTGKGTKTNPYRTIGKGIGAASALGGGTVLVDVGTYAEDPAMANGVDVSCGHDSTKSWTRSSAVTRIRTSTVAGLTFAPGVRAVLEGCVLAWGGTTTTYALITVQDAQATLTDCSADASDSSTRASDTLALAVLGPNNGTTATVNGGSYLGGNGSTTAIGIKVSGMKLELAGAHVSGGASGNDGDLSIGLYVAGTRPSGGGLASTAHVSGTSTFISGGAAGTFPYSTVTPSSIGVYVNGNGSSVLLSEAKVSGGSGYVARGVRFDNAAPSVVRAATLEGGVSGGSADQAAGALIQGTSDVLLDSNAGISGGSAGTASAGVLVRGGTVKVLRNTRIEGGVSNIATLAGISVEGGAPVIDSNVLVVGGPASDRGVGVLVTGGAPEIKGNTLRGAESSKSAAKAYGVFVDGTGGAPPDATLEGNALVEGGFGRDLAVGLQLERAGLVKATGNVLRGGTTSGEAWGVSDGTYSASTSGGSDELDLDANWITAVPPAASQTPDKAGGLFLRGTTSGSVTNNRILGGPADSESYGAHLRFSEVDLFNNYLSGAGTSSTGEAYGLKVRTSLTGTHGAFANNIFDGGRQAVDRWDLAEDTAFHPAVFRNNEFVPDSGGTLYSPVVGTDKKDAASINKMSGYSGNLDVDPKLTSDFHLQPGSPLAGKGLGTNEGAPSKDMDGDARPASGADVGPDEVP